MMMNVWKSEYTDQMYEMPVDWMPQYDGWTLVGTIEKQTGATNRLLFYLCCSTRRTYVRFERTHVRQKEHMFIWDYSNS